ncbi:phage major capsid protein [uncultured Tateyamaria sp.]|uniref:phage major capsid protein n=1 Tax=Tateyamaria sp. 1078 TaxID=3417464 RepID=UPI0026166399|nr:phage major capsid protein [uncultured Tateyamaria sp.]
MRRQSEIRSQLSELVGKETTDDETRQIDTLDAEYRANETKYRGALIVEASERDAASAELENRSADEWQGLIDNFELRQVVANLDTGAAISGQTAEVVTEMRAQGSFQGQPIPWGALERRAGETTSATTPDPTRTMPLVDRLFPTSVAAQLGASLVQVGQGSLEYPVSTASTVASWQTDEVTDLPDPVPFTTADAKLSPDFALGVRMKITRKALKQSGEGLESAIRRDMNGAMQMELDRSLILGSGAAGEPLGIIPGAATYGINVNNLGAAATWAAFRTEVLAFMVGNAASGPGSVRALIRPEVWDRMDGSYITGTAVTEFELMRKAMLGVIMTTNALEAPAGGETTAVLATSAGGLPPIHIGAWGGIDLIRDPYTDAASGQLRLTAIATMDQTVARGAQLRIVEGIQ